MPAVNYYMERSDCDAEHGQMKLEDANDVQLLELAASGEEAAFLALYRRWQRGIYRFSLRLSSSESIAEDITQEVFLMLLDGASRFDPELGSFSSYAYGIARNLVLRRLARERVFAPIIEGPGDLNPDSHKAFSVLSDPIGELTRQEKIASLHRAIATLTLRYREVVVLCELEELNYAEAARVIGCPEGTIRSRLHRARCLLLEKLQEKARENSRTPGAEPARCIL